MRIVSSFFFEIHDFRDYFDRSETNQIALD